MSHSSHIIFHMHTYKSIISCTFLYVNSIIKGSSSTIIFFSFVQLWSLAIRKLNICQSFLDLELINRLPPVEEIQVKYHITIPYSRQLELAKRVTKYSYVYLLLIYTTKISHSRWSYPSENRRKRFLPADFQQNVFIRLFDWKKSLKMLGGSDKFYTIVLLNKWKIFIGNNSLGISQKYLQNYLDNQMLLVILPMNLRLCTMFKTWIEPWTRLLPKSLVI